MTSRYPGNASFVQALHYSGGPGANLPVRRIVIHDMEMAEKPTTAEACAAMFHRPDSPQASCHFAVDDNSVVQCVELDRIAWHAPPNTGSVGIEHAGYASQTRAGWLDDFGAAMLTRSAALTAWLCATFDVPVIKLSAADLLAGRRGITGHADVSAAWHQTDHTDPGTNFPWDWYLEHVRNPGGDMPLTETDVAFLTSHPKFETAIINAVWNHSKWPVAGGTIDAGTRLALAANGPDAAAIAAAVVAALPTGSGPGGSLTVADVEAAVRDVLRTGTEAGA